MEALEPLTDAGQRLNTGCPNHVAVCRLLVAADARHVAMADRIAEESAQDRVIPLPEERGELLVRQRVAFLRECIAPGEPVILRRVDERAVHIPEDGARTRHLISLPQGPLQIDGSRFTF